MNKEIALIGVPMDLGQTRRGVDMGPSAIRYAGSVERLEKLDDTMYDLGDIDVPQRRDGVNKEELPLRNLEEIAIANERLARVSDEQVALNRVPLVLAADHRMRIG